jgi:hypothetical protein
MVFVTGHRVGEGVDLIGRNSSIEIRVNNYKTDGHEIKSRVSIRYLSIFKGQVRVEEECREIGREFVQIAENLAIGAGQDKSQDSTSKIRIAYRASPLDYHIIRSDRRDLLR